MGPDVGPDTKHMDYMSHLDDFFYGSMESLHLNDKDIIVELERHLSDAHVNLVTRLYPEYLKSTFFKAA